MTRRTGERPCDHAAEVVLSDQLATRSLTPLVQLLDRHHIFVCRDLKDAVRRRVDDRFPGPHMLVAELLENHGA